MENSNRKAFIATVRELIENDTGLSEGNGPTEIIYTIDDIIVYGGYDLGERGIDHNILKDSSVSWDDIIRWGVLVVPETATYISDSNISEFDALGYERLGLDRNHIVGY